MFDFRYFSTPDHLDIRYAIARGAPADPVALVLLLQGRAEFIEKYQTIASCLTRAGYRVVSLDWRGQGLSSRETDDRKKGYVASFNDYVSDLEILFYRVLPSRDMPVYMLGHSTGGHVALRFMHAHPDAVDKAVLVSPLIDLRFFEMIRLPLSIIARQACRGGQDKNFVPGGRIRAFKNTGFKSNRLTHDRNGFLIQQQEIEKNPDLAIQGVTWGWLNAAFDSIRYIHQPGYAAAIRTPVLIAGAQKDRVVSFNAQKRFCKLLGNGVFYPVAGAFHEIMFETAAIREPFWRKVHTFFNNDVGELVTC